MREGNLQGRLTRSFECFLPEKGQDSEAYPRILHADCSVERRNAPYIGRYISERISQIPHEHVQESLEKGHPTVLVVGPKQFTRLAHRYLEEHHENVLLQVSAPADIDLLSAYEMLQQDECSRLGWRIVCHLQPPDDLPALIQRAIEQDLELGRDPVR